MLPPLRAILAPQEVYCHELVSAQPDDECFICKDNYIISKDDDSTNPDEDGCRAIRLHSCGHVIGDKCFTTWIRRNPGKCPYWSHKISPINTIQDGNVMVRAMHWICESVWFRFWDDHVGWLIEDWVVIPFDVESENQRRNAFIARQLGLCGVGQILLSCILGTILQATWIITCLAFGYVPLGIAGGLVEFVMYRGAKSLRFWGTPFWWTLYVVGANVGGFLVLASGLLGVGIWRGRR